MSLQGDPAVKINSHNLPELMLSEQDVWTEPSMVDLSKSNFDLKFKVYNFGRAFRDSVFVELKQELPD